MSTPEPRIDVEQVMEQIRKRVRDRYVSAPGAARAASGSTPVPNADFNQLLRLIEHARRCSAAIGAQPPQPPTLRARMSAILVRMVRRMLFWYTPQITDFHNAALRAMKEQVVALESVSTRLNARLANLERLVEPPAAGDVEPPRP